MSSLMENFLETLTEEMEVQELKDKEFDTVIEESLDYLSEEKRTININKQNQKQRLLNQAALMCCKEDPSGQALWRQYVKGTAMRKSAREVIRSKYQTAAKRKVAEYYQRRKAVASKKK